MYGPHFAVTYGGTPVETLIEEHLPKSKWQYSIRYLEMSAAAEWGIPPNMFYDQPMESRAMMVQYLITKRHIEAYQEYLSSKEAERSARRARSRGRR